MGDCFYFKSRPGVMWTFVKETGVWTRSLIFPRTIEPAVDVIRIMNSLNDNSWYMNKIGETDDR